MASLYFLVDNSQIGLSSTYWIVTFDKILLAFTSSNFPSSNDFRWNEKSRLSVASSTFEGVEQLYTGAVGMYGMI